MSGRLFECQRVLYFPYNLFYLWFIVGVQLFQYHSRRHILLFASQLHNHRGLAGMTWVAKKIMTKGKMAPNPNMTHQFWDSKLLQNPNTIPKATPASAHETPSNTWRCHFCNVHGIDGLSDAHRESHQEPTADEDRKIGTVTHGQNSSNKSHCSCNKAGATTGRRYRQ